MSKFGVGSYIQDSLKDIAEALPHGSGVDCPWQGYVTATHVCFTNAYHCMDENGFYCGFADFTVKLPLQDKTIVWDEFKLQFNGNLAQHLNKKYYLREYIIDIIYYALAEYFYYPQ